MGFIPKWLVFMCLEVSLDQAGGVGKNPLAKQGGSGLCCRSCIPLVAGICGYIRPDRDIRYKHGYNVFVLSGEVAVCIALNRQSS